MRVPYAPLPHAIPSQSEPRRSSSRTPPVGGPQSRLRTYPLWGVLCDRSRRERERSVPVPVRARQPRPRPPVRRPNQPTDQPTSTIAAHAATERPTTAEVKGKIEPDFMPWFASRSAIAAVRASSETRQRAEHAAVTLVVVKAPAPAVASSSIKRAVRALSETAHGRSVLVVEGSTPCMCRAITARHYFPRT